MILLLSTTLDLSTNDIIDWLDYYDANYERIDGDVYFNSDIEYKCRITNKDIKISLGELSLNKIKSVWHRRWIKYNNSFIKELDYFDEISIGTKANIKGHLVAEMKKSYKPLFDLLNSKEINSLPNFSSIISLDKIKTLKLASSIGLTIPESLICNSKKNLKEFKKKYKTIISKPLSEAMSFMGKEYDYLSKTSLVSDNFIDSLTETFFPSLFQEYIEKEIEVRSFYIENDFYSMAIFSQLDDKTTIDFRNYNDENPNRNVPFKLPIEIEEKLRILMTQLNLNTGSIDIILTPNNRFVFLEVNPVGQFGMTSYPCNYYLEKKISEYLIKNENK